MGAVEEVGRVKVGRRGRRASVVSRSVVSRSVGEVGEVGRVKVGRVKVTVRQLDSHTVTVRQPHGNS